MSPSAKVTNLQNCPHQYHVPWHQGLGKLLCEPGRGLKGKKQVSFCVKKHRNMMKKAFDVTSGTGSSKACFSPGITDGRYGARS